MPPTHHISSCLEGIREVGEHGRIVLGWAAADVTKRLTQHKAKDLSAGHGVSGQPGSLSLASNQCHALWMVMKPLRQTTLIN